MQLEAGLHGSGVESCLRDTFKVSQVIVHVSIYLHKRLYIQYPIVSPPTPQVSIRSIVDEKCWFFLENRSTLKKNALHFIEKRYKEA